MISSVPGEGAVLVVSRTSGTSSTRELVKLQEKLFNFQ